LLTHTPHAVIFDLDGLILDTEFIYRMTWQRSATSFGYSMSDDLYASFAGRRDVDCETLLVETYGREFPVSDFLRRSDHLSQKYVKKHGVSTKPGLFELLDFIDAKRILKAVATSTELLNALFSLGKLAGRFDVIVAGDDVANGKPAPDIFLLCADRLQVRPRHCLVLEDAEAGVQAAHAAGMPMVIVPDLNYPSTETAAKAVCVCSSLHHVKDLLMPL
jgi:beta-phosphoglucomutase-like phosphatase (HAD superfamily)